MQIKIFESVRNWLNPKPQVVEKNPSSEKIDAVAKYYKRYSLVFFGRKCFNVKVPKGEYIQLIWTLIANFFGSVLSFIVGLLSLVGAAALIFGYPIVLLWAMLSKIYVWIFGGILSACAEDSKSIYLSLNQWHREKPNVCGCWSFVAKCSNNLNLDIYDGVCSGHYSSDATANAMEIIKSNIFPEYTIASSSVITDSENYKLSIEYVVRKNDE